MIATARPSPLVRHRIRVAGLVQGVGFRPFVHRLATDLDLAGHVGNDTDGVFVEVEGRAEDVDRFEVRLGAEAPPLARIDGCQVTAISAVGEATFRIVESRDGGPAKTWVSPDVAVCDDCLAELFDPANRRYRYPFINCTNCGPRFTITVRLPYDRPNTTMGGFTLSRRAQPSTTIRRTGASTPSRSPAPSVVPGSGSSLSPAARSAPPQPSGRLRRRSGAARSSPSRASAVITWRATPGPPRPSQSCAPVSTGRRSHSR